MFTEKSYSCLVIHALHLDSLRQLSLHSVQHDQAEPKFDAEKSILQSDRFLLPLLSVNLVHVDVHHGCRSIRAIRSYLQFAHLAFLSQDMLPGLAHAIALSFSGHSDRFQWRLYRREEMLDS